MADGQAQRLQDDSAMHVRELCLRALRESDREADFVCSTETVDSYGTILKQDWDLKRYKRNPVVLWAHCARELPVGQTIKIRVEEGALVATIRFATEKANPMAEKVWQSILEGTLRGISVGFDAMEYHYEKFDGVDVLVLSKLELWELSITPIPSNPDALQKARSRAAELRAKDHPPAVERGGERQKEDTMDPKDQEIAALKTKLSERDAELSASKARATEVEKASAADKTRLEALEAQSKRLAEERDSERAAREIVEAQLIEREVGELVNKKITAAEKDLFVKLRKSNRELFDEMVKQRSDMKLGEQIIPTDTSPTPPVDARSAAQTSDAEDAAAFIKSLS